MAEFWDEPIEDPKDAGVLLVSLAVGLATGAGLLAVAAVLCGFVILVLWVQQAFRGKDVRYQLWGSSPNELRYEVSVPLDQDIKKLTKIIRRLDGHDTSVDWEIKRYETVRT